VPGWRLRDCADAAEAGSMQAFYFCHRGGAQVGDKSPKSTRKATKQKAVAKTAKGAAAEKK